MQSVIRIGSRESLLAVRQAEIIRDPDFKVLSGSERLRSLQ